MAGNDRLMDLKLGGAFLAWNFSSFPVTCLVMFAQAFCYAAVRLSEAGKLTGELQAWFWHIYGNAALSLDAMKEERYYTLATNILFLANPLELVFAWAGLWFILSYVEIVYGKLWSMLVLVLPCIAANASFLLLAHWSVLELDDQVAAWQVRLLEICRTERSYNDLPWRPVPLWLGIGIFAMIRLPQIRVWQNRLPMWLFVAILAGLEFTFIRSHHGQFYAKDTLIASALTGVCLALLSLVLAFRRQEGKQHNGRKSKERRRQSTFIAETAK